MRVAVKLESFFTHMMSVKHINYALHGQWPVCGLPKLYYLYIRIFSFEDKKKKKTEVNKIYV